MRDKTLIAMAGAIYATFAVRNNNTKNLHNTNYINRRINLEFNSKHNLDKSRMITISAENSNHKSNNHKSNNHIIHTPETDSEFQRGWMKNCEKIRVISRENYEKLSKSTFVGKPRFYNKGLHNNLYLGLFKNVQDDNYHLFCLDKKDSITFKTNSTFPNTGKGFGTILKDLPYQSVDLTFQTKTIINTSNTSNKRNGGVVNIGELQGFTGPLESMIGAMSGGAHLAVTEANASGKYLQGTINIVQGDSVCIDPAVAIAQAEIMINDDNVMAIMGPNCSGNTGAVITNVLVPNGIVAISPSATSPALTTLEDGGWFFRTAPSDARQGPILASIAMSRGQTDMAVTHSNSDYGKGLADAFVTAYEAAGGTVTVIAGHNDDKADYSADVAALSAGGSATLAILGYADTGGRGIIAASEDTGAFSDYVFGDGMISDVTSGAVQDGSWGVVPSPDATLAANWKAVAAAGGVDGTGVYSAESYDAMALIILASQAARSTDRAAIQAQIMNVANAPGIPCHAGKLGDCLKMISGGLQVNYVGASGVELDAGGTANGSYAESEVVGGVFTNIKIHT